MVGTDINLLVAVTDGDWFNVLRKQPDLREVNFWSPSESNFQGPEEGRTVPVQTAREGWWHDCGRWCLHIRECTAVFAGVGGVRVGEWCQLVDGDAGGYQALSQGEPNDKNDFKIGCRILTQPFFFEKSDWIPAPKDWSPNIVRFKKYDASSVEGRKLWDAVNDRMSRAGVSNDEQVPLWDERCRCGLTNRHAMASRISDQATPGTGRVSCLDNGYLSTSLRSYGREDTTSAGRGPYSSV